MFTFDYDRMYYVYLLLLTEIFFAKMYQLKEIALC